MFTVAVNVWRTLTTISLPGESGIGPQFCTEKGGLHGSTDYKGELKTLVKRDTEHHVERDRVQELKTAGKSADEIAASKPFADLDATWGKGFFNGDVFVKVVYSTL